MPDTRVLKKMATWFFYITASVLLFMATAWLGHYLFDTDQETVANCIVGAFGFYFLYEAAKVRVDMERNAEQRLLDKLRDLK